MDMDLSLKSDIEGEAPVVALCLHANIFRIFRVKDGSSKKKRSGMLQNDEFSKLTFQEPEGSASSL